MALRWTKKFWPKDLLGRSPGWISGELTFQRSTTIRVFSAPLWRIEKAPRVRGDLWAVILNINEKI